MTDDELTVVERQILDIVRHNPDASVEEIKGELNGTPEWRIKMVLENHEDRDYEPHETIDPRKLSLKEKRLLWVINEYPSASQRDLSPVFDCVNDSGRIGSVYRGIADWTWKGRSLQVPPLFSESGGLRNWMPNNEFKEKVNEVVMTEKNNSNDDTESNETNQVIGREDVRGMMEDVELTETDKRMLWLIYDNSDANQSELAKKDGVSKNAIKKRMDRLYDKLDFSWTSRYVVASTLFDGGMLCDWRPEDHGKLVLEVEVNRGQARELLLGGGDFPLRERLIEQILDESFGRE